MKVLTPQRRQKQYVGGRMNWILLKKICSPRAHCTAENPGKGSSPKAKPIGKRKWWRTDPKKMPCQNKSPQVKKKLRWVDPGNSLNRDSGWIQATTLADARRLKRTEKYFSVFCGGSVPSQPIPSWCCLPSSSNASIHLPLPTFFHSDSTTVEIWYRI